MSSTGSLPIVSATNPELNASIDPIVRTALAEDIGTGDATADLIEQGQMVSAVLVAKEPAVLCGSAWFAHTFECIDPQVRVDWYHADGDELVAGDEVCALTGSAHAINTGERTAINFLQTLSGTATTARRFASAVAGSGCQILDTRKTIPGLRMAQKYAVRCGGGANHRMGLYDAILIKENHIASAGSLERAVERARAAHPALTLEIEVESLDELRRALDAGADIVMLDDFTLPDIATAVKQNNGRAKLEVSGSVDIDGLAALAATGVDYVSSGALTKHLHAIDFSLRVRTQR